MLDRFQESLQGPRVHTRVCVAEIPILAEQTIVPSVVDVTNRHSVPPSHQTRLTTHKSHRLKLWVYILECTQGYIASEGEVPRRDLFSSVNV